ncbi:MAG: exopolysaccharide Pel transporter PelG [Selenomonas sp.]|uniref:exopolysaccharide Pel transporter PelG n=1 Tax=Selenomonas sp. TaxID=2053611 RepID=UPI0025DB4D5B|nr:exopolysaccharide Pel transporter PelG [Selenomonas sp.]MCR5756946.1 exopolysaccharide Pel transporter PelG [Selenomonas sp.]
MAGVGFELKKLFTARTAAGHIKAYSYSAIITAGPFALMTSMVLAVQSIFACYGVAEEASQLYVASVVYAFVFSQIFSAGFIMVLTRYLADSLSVGRLADITASLFGMGAILIALGAVAAGLFFWDKPLPLLTKWLGYLFFAELLLAWTESVYLSAVKRYSRLLCSYLAGVLLSIFLVWLLLNNSGLQPEQSGLLAMDVGMGVINLLFLLHITSYFGTAQGGQNFAFLPYFERHWRLFFTATFYMLGLFLPNVIIWQGEWGTLVGGTYRYSPVYDVVTFYAFLSILPLMTMFVVTVETNFYERYAHYFSYITQKGNFREIDDARKDLLHTLWFELRHIVEFQLVFTLVALAVGNYLLSWSGITYNQVNMYNVLLFGVFFTGLLQLVYILLVYFDYQKSVLSLSAVFFLANLIFGLWGLCYGGAYSYGFTFFLAAALSFIWAFHKLNYFTQRINYLVFCSQPVFYRSTEGPLTKLTLWLYGDKYVNLETVRGDDHENKP